MNDEAVERTLTAARRAALAWNAQRQHQLRWAVLGRLSRRRRRPFPLGLMAIAAGVTAVVAIVAAGWRVTALHVPAMADHRQEVAAPATVLALVDGTTIAVDGPATVLRKTVEAETQVAFELEQGGATFQVARRPTRTFRVHAGAVTVQVIGTRFRVQRHDTRTHVSVQRGRVLVSWSNGSRQLGIGEEGDFPPVAAPEQPVAAAEVVTTSSPSPIPSPARTRRPARAPSGPAALFARADQARAQGKPEQAIVYLREIVDRHPADPHAPMAAFTAGRLLLESLGNPRQAAAAFEKARLLANGGSLVEDSLAREIEARAAAGDAATARERAELYVRLFPNGSRLHAVRRLGGIKAPP